ncbi:type II toxin-antitoxin system prevent-host-death family antitoxin [Rhodococcus aerolatus]
MTAADDTPSGTVEGDPPATVPVTVPVTEARARIAEVVGRAEHGGRRTVLTRHGRAAAAVVPVADLERLRALDAARHRDRLLDDAHAVTVAVTLPCDPATAWRSLVDPTLLGRWWPGAVLVDEVGLPVGGVEPAAAEVTAVAAPRLLELAWTDPGPAAASVVRLELVGEQAPTTAVLTHRGLVDVAATAQHRTGWERRLDAWRALLAA